MSEVLARKLAREVREDFGLADSRSFELLELLEELEVRVLFERPAGRDAEGMSFEIEEAEVIFADPSLSARRLRFTLAHELGHLLLCHGAHACSSAAIHGTPANRQEQEANIFASELLMPTPLFRRDIEPVHPRVQELSALANRYDTSLTATALRYVRETRDRCAVIGVGTDREPWFKKSDNFGWYLTLPPGPDTLVFDHVNGGERVESVEVPATAWLERFSWRGDWRIVEDVVQVHPREWLVVLSEIPDPDDDPDLLDREAEEEQDRRRMRFDRWS